MPDENAEHNKYLLDQPILVSAAVTQITNKGELIAIILNIRLHHDNLREGHCEAILIRRPHGERLLDAITSFLKSGHHRDIRDFVFSSTGSTNTPADHPLLQYDSNKPANARYAHLTNRGRQTVAFCHVHDFAG